MMIDLKNIQKTLIFQENVENESYLQEWFSFRDKKVLNYIDTLYYTIRVDQDTSADSRYQPFLEFIRSLEFKSNLNDVPYCPCFSDTPFFLGNLKAPGGYTLHLFVPDCYDVFVSPATPTEETPFIQVQLRSTFLWLTGVKESVQISRRAIFDVLELFGFNDYDLSIHINRVDYCFHTNYIQSPFKFFAPQNIARMQCSRFKESFAHVEYLDGCKYQIDWYTFGKRGNPVYVRMYLKSKEVVECGYKNKKCFFISIWQQAGLISRYDAYVLTHAYIKSNWNYVDAARLEYYLDYGKNIAHKKAIESLLGSPVKDWVKIRALADKLTPKLRLVVNVEFQCLRKFFRSVEFPQKEDNEVLNVIHWTNAVTEYLTNHTFKFVKYDPDKDNQKNKYKCPVIPFWQLIQSAKFGLGCIDVPVVRRYSSETNLEMLKSRVYSGVSSLSLCVNGDNSNGLLSDIETLIGVTNDNDIAQQRQKKEQKRARISKLDSSIFDVHKRKIQCIDLDTGEILI